MSDGLIGRHRRTRRLLGLPFKSDQTKPVRDAYGSESTTSELQESRGSYLFGASVAGVLWLGSLVVSVGNVLFGGSDLVAQSVWVAFTTLLLWVLTLPYRAAVAEQWQRAEQKRAADLLDAADEIDRQAARITELEAALRQMLTVSVTMRSRSTLDHDSAVDAERWAMDLLGDNG